MIKEESVVCPFCGEKISRNASVCKHCGSDERTGWSDGTYLDGIDLPEEVNYEELCENEFGPKKITRKSDWKLITGILLLITIFLAFIIGNLVR